MKEHAGNGFLASLAARSKPLTKGTVWRWGFGAFALLAFQLLRIQLRRARVHAKRRRLNKALENVRCRLSVSTLVANANKSVATSTASCFQLAKGTALLADVLHTTSAGLQAASRTTVGLNTGENDNEQDKIADVNAFFDAWSDVASASDDASLHFQEAVESLRSGVADLESRRMAFLNDASSLELSLAAAEVDAETQMAPKTWPFSVFGPRLTNTEVADIEETLESQRTVTYAGLERIRNGLCEIKEEVASFARQGVEELCQPVKPIGEILMHLQPGQRTPSGSKSSTNSREGTPNANVRPVGQMVGKLIQSMTTPEGRKKLREAEEAEEANCDCEDAKPKSPPPVTSAPVQKREEGEWRMSGLYKHQVLKAGLRKLDEEWSTADLLKFPQNSLLDVGAALLRESLFRGMLDGALRLQSITGNDVAAAQRDLEKLTLRQLLRLRVLHIDFTPSGAGADSISTVGSRHEAFINKLDGRLFDLLGRKAAGTFLEPSGQFHKLGVEAVLIGAAAASIPSVQPWSWWISHQRRVYLDPVLFETSAEFPTATGVLEIIDFSRSDKQEPSGKLQWIDWIIRSVAEKTLLAAGPLEQAVPVQTIAEGATAQSDCSDGSPSVAVGGSKSSASLVSPNLLRDVRGALRPVGANK